MRTLTVQLLFFWLCFNTSFLTAQVESYKDVKNQNEFNDWATQVNLLRTTHPDSALNLYQLSYEYFLEKKDTLNAVNSLVEKAVNLGHSVQYQSAYDNLWQALFLADKAQNNQAKIGAYIILGRYYSFYKRKEKAFEYFNRALALSKDLVKKGELTEQDLVKCYYALCSTYRDLDDPNNAKIYLDSSYLFHNAAADEGTTYFLKFEEAIILGKNKKHQEALDSMFVIQSWFEENSPGFMVLIYTHIGDVYLAKREKEKAENYYQKALNTSDEYKSHIDFLPTIYERLSNLYVQSGDYQKAYKSLSKEQQLDNQFFDSRSENNRALLEIKDDFREEKERQEKLIQEQRIAALEQEERANFLENIIFLVIIVSLLFAGFLYFKYLRKKHKYEKQLIRKKRELELKQANELRELEIKQANELLELKNKELATSSLKLIEKDEILATLKDRLSKGNGDIKAAELKKIVRTISHSNAQNWEEFEARFMSVNRNFYQKINEKYPKLSRGDQKLCALVKLNLSSKEMAKLLGISIESVHTNRYRLRKKLSLDREVSLTEFIAKL